MGRTLKHHIQHFYRFISIQSQKQELPRCMSQVRLKCEIPLGSSLFFPSCAIIERDHLTRVDNVTVRDAFGVRRLLKLQIVIISFFFLITSPNMGYLRMHLGEL